MKKLSNTYRVSLGAVHTHTHTHGYLCSEYGAIGGSREHRDVVILPRDFE